MEGLHNPHLFDIKIRYAETDAMGFVHHGNYYTYFEAARIEVFEALGYPYQEMEKQGILIPVIASQAEYKKPAFFGDVITIKSTRYLVGRARIKFLYQVIKQGNTIATGQTLHAFIHPKGHPLKPPAFVYDLFPKENSAH